jgi:ribosomal protein S18 acetylase RimI-like enzyme
MVVLPDYRKCGIGKSLIKTALNHAQNHGITSVILYTSMFQPTAIAMYEKYGWVRQNTVGVMILLDRVSIFFYCLDLSTAKI